MHRNRKRADAAPSRGIARAALEGASHDELIREALTRLARVGQADRFGAWLSPSDHEGLNQQQETFHGVVLELDGAESPREWTKLAPQIPLPMNELTAGRVAKQDYSPGSPQLQFGLLAGLRVALWVPVLRSGALFGILFAGSRTHRASLPQSELEAVAAELSLVLELEHERTNSLRRQADLKFCKESFAALAERPALRRWLARIVESCTESSASGALGAEFAGIIRTAGSVRPLRLEFHWKSGDEKWFAALESEPFSRLCEHALETGQTAGMDWSLAGKRAAPSRVIVLPLVAEGNKFGAFVVGLSAGGTSLANLQRLELRASCAAAALAALGREEMEQQAGSDFRTPAEMVALMEWLDEGVVLFDERNRIRGTNSRFAQLTGISRGDLAGLMDFEALLARLASGTVDPETFAERWRSAARNPDPGLREEVHLTAPVSRVLERTSRPVLDASGKNLGRIELYRDLTSQRIHQSRLLHTEKLAALGQMISGVAHELSNPLTSIVGYAQRLLLRKDELSGREELHRIFAEAERASGILRQMLLTARETPPERRPLSLNQVILRTVELQKFGVASEKIRVELDLDPLIPPVLGDAGQLQQVLMNLMGNARQALEVREAGGVIRVRTVWDGRDRVRLEVFDNGPGIPDHFLPRIFDPFFTTKPAGAGTGLGLAIVQGIVREHGGEVFVKSSPGKGTTFTIDLPAAGKTRPGTKGTSAIAAAKSGHGELRFVPETDQSSPSIAAALRVLVVEDEPTVAQLIADVLCDEGFQVETVMSGREAQRRASNEDFDLAICDMKMPGFDGAQFYRALVRSKNPLQHKFLFVTGDVLASQTRDFLEKSRIPYVAKPFRVDELMEKVRRVLGAAPPPHADSLEEQSRNAALKG